MQCPTPNENLLDRLIRALLGEVAFILGLFWLGTTWRTAAYAVSFILIFTAASGFCGLYRVLKFDTRRLKWRPNPKIAMAIGTTLFLAIAIGGSYASNFFTRKFFLEDFNRMNNHYKQTLFTTGQEQRDSAIKHYDNLKEEYAVFKNKYSTNRPYSLRRDELFVFDLISAEKLIESQKEAITSGDLKASHLEFEKVRNIFQEMLKRNGFSMLAVYLVDFHDAMEKVIAAADAKDAVGVTSAYQEADLKLKEVEGSANDQEIQDIRKNLESVLKLAEDGEIERLPTKAAELKSSFVKVYLKRG